MSRSSIPEPPGFAELSKAEQIAYVQALWDRIAEAPDDIPVPEGHLRLIDERLSAYQRGGASRAHSAYDILENLAQDAD